MLNSFKKYYDRMTKSLSRDTHLQPKRLDTVSQLLKHPAVPEYSYHHVHTAEHRWNRSYIKETHNRLSWSNNCHSRYSTATAHTTPYGKLIILKVEKLNVCM